MLTDVDGNGQRDLFNLVAKVPKNQRYSDWWDHAPKNGKDDGIGEHSELDHFLVSKGLKARVGKVWIDHTHNPADVSDHWP